MHYFSRKILNKGHLQQIGFNHSSDFKEFMNLYKTISVLVIDTPPASDPLCFKKNPLERR